VKANKSGAGGGEKQEASARYGKDCGENDQGKRRGRRGAEVKKGEAYANHAFGARQMGLRKKVRDKKGGGKQRKRLDQKIKRAFTLARQVRRVAGGKGRENRFPSGWRSFKLRGWRYDVGVLRHGRRVKTARSPKPELDEKFPVREG